MGDNTATGLNYELEAEAFLKALRKGISFLKDKKDPDSRAASEILGLEKKSEDGYFKIGEKGEQILSSAFKKQPERVVAFLNSVNNAELLTDSLGIKLREKGGEKSAYQLSRLNFPYLEKLHSLAVRNLKSEEPVFTEQDKDVFSSAKISKSEFAAFVLNEQSYERIIDEVQQEKELKQIAEETAVGALNASRKRGDNQRSL